MNGRIIISASVPVRSHLSCPLEKVIFTMLAMKCLGVGGIGPGGERIFPDLDIGIDDDNRASNGDKRRHRRTRGEK